MATNDLMSELQKDSIKLDDDSERKVVKMLLKLLEDKNGEVQNLAVKCLGPLVNKVKEFQVETIVETLCNNMLSDKEQLRDISSIGLKTVISELPPSSTALAANICKKITGRLTSAISKEDVSVQLEALDILGDLLSRFGSLLITFHPSIQSALLPQLASSRLAVRKRSIIAISHLVLSCNQSLFQELIDYLLLELSKNSSTSTTRTYIQCIGAISRAAGHRIGEHLERIVPHVVRFCQIEDDELREYCIQAFESFVRRCPKESSPHIHTIIQICLKYLTYDPNYNYDDDGDDEMDAEDEDDDDEDDEYSDDDDMSWKVRRAAAKSLEAIIATRHDMLAEFYTQVSPALIVRFKEREENVKADIFHAYITLLKQTKPQVSTLDPNAMESEDGPVAMLQSQIPNIVKSVHKQLKEKSIKNRQGCFALLTELVVVLPGAMNNHIAALVPGIHFSLGEKNSSSNMKIDTLAFLNCLLSNHNPTVFHPHINVLVPPVVACIGDPFYKITSEALLVTQQLVKVMRPLDMNCTFDFRPYLTDIYECTIKRLKAADIDQEVKERAISTVGQIITNMGDNLGPELAKCLPIFLERLKNEITRLTTVKALTLIASSPLNIDIRPILTDSIPILASFLRKNHRALRLSTLQCLDVLVKNYGQSFTPAIFNDIMKELPTLINESDLHLSQLTLTLLTSMSKVNKSTMASVHDGVLPQLFVLIRSPLLQGAALGAMLEFYQALVAARTPGASFQDMLRMLTEPIYKPSNIQSSTGLAVHKQSFQSISKCIAALTVSNETSCSNVVSQFVGELKGSKTTDSVKLLSLFTLGEIGKHVDLSTLQEDIMQVILSCFASSNEEVKSAASYALGNVTVGNLAKFLPYVLQEIEKQPKRQYLLLHSLKEIISCESSSSSGLESLSHYTSTIWNLLMKECECPEEGTRNVVAECLGKLTLIDPERLLPQLKQHLESPSALTRATVVTAVKFTISDQPQVIDSLLRVSMGDFLRTITDSDLNVRRVALVAFNSAAHNKPSLIRDLLGEILPHLYEETVVKKDLIREVQMGPFKHTVDDGLDIRKAAFECMYTLLDACLDRIDIFEFLTHVEAGLNDHYDIKMLTYLMIARLAHLCPNAVLQHLDQIIEPLRTTCTTKVKANSVKQEFEKQDELKRSAMRAVAALLHITDADKNPQMNEFISQIKANQELYTIFESQKDASATASETSLMDIS